MREAILATVRDHGEITFKDLTRGVQTRLRARFEGSISWYVTSIKLDLEARGAIERIAGSRPQRLRLTGAHQ